MIAGVVRHARTSRDARALQAHLMHPENSPSVRVLAGSLATDLAGALADMQRLRDSTSADAAALHIHLSPSRAMSDQELSRAAEIVIQHFGAVGHSAVLIVHEKMRNGGDGDRHGHLVLGRVAPDGRVLEAGYEKIKLETAARLIEHELGELPTLGRHHRSAVKWLWSNGRSDVADWLEAAYGAAPDKPLSPASPASRQGLARQGINLSAVRSEIRDAWTASGAEAIRAAGYEITPGRKSGVWIVGRDGVEIGSLDRLVGEKRATIRSAMEAVSNPTSRKTSKLKNTQRIRKPVQRRSESAEGDPSSRKPANFQPRRLSSIGVRQPLIGKKTAFDEIAEAARKWTAAITARLDNALTVSCARRWLRLRQAELKAQIVSAAPDCTEGYRDVARMRHELAVLVTAATILTEDPELALGGEAVLMGAARRRYAERATGHEEIGLNPLSDLLGVSNGLNVASAQNATGLRLGPRPDEPPNPDTVPRGGIEKAANSRDESENTSSQPPEKPVQRRSQGAMDDPSSRNRRVGHSLRAAVKAAHGFLDSREADLHERIAELALPHSLPDPNEIIEAQDKLSDLAQELAEWDGLNSASIAKLRIQTDRSRPVGFIAWVLGATARYDAANRQLAVFYEQREPLKNAVSHARRCVRILKTVQETRQAQHDASRRRDFDRLKSQLELIPAARLALAENPRIALGGGKALAAAARQRRAEHHVAERRNVPEETQSTDPQP